MGNQDAPDPVEKALAEALVAATAAAQWDVVRTLADELSERRRARMNVVSIESARKRGSK